MSTKDSRIAEIQVQLDTNLPEIDRLLYESKQLAERSVELSRKASSLIDQSTGLVDELQRILSHEEAASTVRHRDIH
jgi:thiamine monophosphate kinase